MTLQIVNAVIIMFIIIAVTVIIMRFIIKKNYSKYMDDEIVVNNDYDIENLMLKTKSIIQNILRERVEDLNLNKYETEKRKKNKTKLRKAVRDAPTGDIGAKSYVKDYIQDILQTKLGVNETTIDKIIPFNEPEKLTTLDRFEIVLHVYKNSYGYRALECLIKENELDKLRNEEFDITEQDIKQIYRKKVNRLKYSDKIAIVCQRIYELYIGNGAVDEIRDMRIDGVSGGVSGVPEAMFDYAEAYLTENEKIDCSYESIWIFFEGKSIHLSCIGFGSQKEFERVCKNIGRYNNPGQLSENRGYLTNEVKDGSRVIIGRPNFSDSWIFILRKHQNGKVITPEKFITDKGKEIPLFISECMVKGCQIIALTGGQGSGKTTYLRGLIKYIKKTYNLRIQELIFELGLRTVFGKRNIITFKETPNVSGQEGLDLQKKTDGDINILGEVATSPVANWVIQMSQVASLMTMFTHHAKTTQSLITWMRDALLKDGGLSNERAAEDEVVHCINFDIHMAVVRNGENYGHRYIERITEIIPLDNNDGDEQYKLVNIVEFNKEKKCYELKARFSDRAEQEMFKNFADEDIRRYKNFFEENGFKSGGEVA